MSGPSRTTSAAFAARVRANRGMIFPLACVSLLLVLLVPLPAKVLDFLLVMNLTLSVIILVTTIYVQSPREFAVFPSLLLAVTLFRLVLNVATTRLILSGNGSEASAGDVVAAFSHLVTHGSVAVGAIIFLIIFVIQFVVISKGGSRISEVAARFELDALPGKQMAIDADLNAGLITQQQARERREQVGKQADFYAAMEGAGKFVRGDAIAGVIIALVNIVGGLYVGMSAHDLSLAQCLPLYTKLTIGDGLVSQVPAFIVALAAGLIVTRNSADSDLGEDVIGQLLAKPQALLVAAAFLAILAILGMPKLPLLILGTCCVALAYVLNKPGGASSAAIDADAEMAGPSQALATKDRPVVERFLDLDVLEIELGHGLARWGDESRGGELLERIGDVRQRIASELGILVPAIGIRDSDRLGVNDYSIAIRGQVIARGVAYPDQYLAIDHGNADAPIIHGEESADPASGRLAYWITDSQRDEAEALNYGVIDALLVMLNHLTEVIRAHAAELVTRQAVKDLLDNLRTRAAAVVEEVVPQQIKPGEVQKVLQNLLRERVPVRDLETILETLGDVAPRTRDVEVLTEHVRVSLARAICKLHVDEQDRLPCIMLDAALEERIAGHVEQADGAGGVVVVGGGGGGGNNMNMGMVGVAGIGAGAGIGLGIGGSINTMPPGVAQHIGEGIAEQAEAALREGYSKVVVLCAPAVRSTVRRLVEPIAPQLGVLSLAEIVGDVKPHVVAVVGEAEEDVSLNSADRKVEDGYEPANV